jgi:hypothetical protein
MYLEEEHCTALVFVAAGSAVVAAVVPFAANRRLPVAVEKRFHLLLKLEKQLCFQHQ